MTARLFLQRVLFALLFVLSSEQLFAAPPLKEECDWGTNELIEFYHSKLDHYFYVSPCGELRMVDSGSAGADWKRTGWSFGVLGSGATSYRGFPVWRFYGSVFPGPNSHFYTSNYDEMMSLRALQKITPDSQPRWNYDNTDFGVYLLTHPYYPTYKPCYDLTITRIIRRFYNQGFENQRDPNHRFVAETATEVIADMKSRGWKDEGAVFCVRGAWLNGVEK